MFDGIHEKKKMCYEHFPCYRKLYGTLFHSGVTQETQYRPVTRSTPNETNVCITRYLQYWQKERIFVFAFCNLISSELSFFVALILTQCWFTLFSLSFECKTSRRANKSYRTWANVFWGVYRFTVSESAALSAKHVFSFLFCQRVLKWHKIRKLWLVDLKLALRQSNIAEWRS